jgi:hypothetical protein
VKRNKAAFNKKRDAFLQDLLRNIDLLIYAELSAIYYMECADNLTTPSPRILLTSAQLFVHPLPSPSRHTIHLPYTQTRLPPGTSTPQALPRCHLWLKLSDHPLASSPPPSRSRRGHQGLSTWRSGYGFRRPERSHLKVPSGFAGCPDTAHAACPTGCNYHSSASKATDVFHHYASNSSAKSRLRGARPA